MTEPLITEADRKAAAEIDEMWQLQLGKNFWPSDARLECSEGIIAKHHAAEREELENVKEELAYVLSDWNDLVKASGSPTNGGAIGFVRAERERARRMEEALNRMLVSFAGNDEELCMECGEKIGSTPSCESCYVIGEARAALEQK